MLRVNFLCTPNSEMSSAPNLKRFCYTQVLYPTDQLSHKMLINLRKSAIVQNTQPTLPTLAFSDRSVRNAQQQTQLKRARAIGGGAPTTAYNQNVAEYVAMRSLCS